MITLLNPLTPKSDSYVTSPYNIYTLSRKQVMRTQNYQLEVVISSQHQILMTNLQGNV